MTAIPGASQVFWGGWVTYTIEAKTRCLGVPSDSLDRYGPVSQPVALEMAQGAYRQSGTPLTVAITGVAGPGSADGIVPGTVWIALAGKWSSYAKVFHLQGNRVQIQHHAAATARILMIHWWKSQGYLDMGSNCDDNFG